MRFRRPRGQLTRSCRCDVDRRGRLVVMSTAEIFAAPPVVVLDADATDAEIGAALRAALEASPRGEVETIPNVEPDLERLGITWGELDSAPGLGLEEGTTSMRLYGWTPAQHGGRERADVDDVVLADPTDAELGSATRGLLRALGSGPPLPEHSAEPFGFKTCWLAIREAGGEVVANAIGLTEREPASWREGLGRTGAARTVFVSPQAGGWTFVVGVAWLEDFDVLASLSVQLGTDVQYFASHRVPEAHLWARAEHGRLTRVAGYVGERGEACGEGEPTDVERRLGVDWMLPRWSEEPPELEDYPTEETVAEIAGEWSVNPLTLAQVPSAPEPGLVGRVTEPLG